MPIACYFCQSACATCEHAVQRFVRDATDEEIQNLSASSITMFCLLSCLKQKACTLLSDKLDSVGNILEEDCREGWEALTPEDCQRTCWVSWRSSVALWVSTTAP